MSVKVVVDLPDEEEIGRATAVWNCAAFPCNPFPFALALAALCRGNADAIKTMKAKKLLWVLNGMCYGQMAKIDLVSEWDKFLDMQLLMGEAGD